jgi:hypothetical protein
LAPEAWDIADLIAAGWREEDLEWERTCEAAIEKLAAGETEAARSEIARALRIAAANFPENDPRLATSLANQGAALTSAGEGHLAGRTISDALAAWRRVDGWIAKMTAPRVARSSLFHMRMEQRHRATYEERWRVKGTELAAEARDKIDGAGELSLIAPDEASAGIARWARERPAMLNDTRKLLAAVLLLVSRRR